MALKDWKKQKLVKWQSGWRLTWRSKKDRDMCVNISEDIFNNKKLWIFTTNFDKRYYEGKYFKTKQQALKFAKSYMRTH